MALINILLVVCFIAFFFSSDVNARKCYDCRGKQAEDVAKCDIRECKTGEVCVKDIFKSATNDSLTAAYRDNALTRGCVNPEKVKTNIGSCIDVPDTSPAGTIVLITCVCDSDKCNSATSFQSWTSIIFIIWLGLFLNVLTLTGQH